MSSFSLGQKLADSLLHFVNEDSLSFCETESIQASNGDRLLWKGSLEMLKDLMLQVQEQGKLVSPGGEAQRFKSADKLL